MLNKRLERIFFYKKLIMMAIAQILIFSLTAGNVYAKDNPTKNTEQLIQVKTKTSTLRLFYSSKLDPLAVTHVNSPVEGIVVKLFFSYGQKVTQGQKLFTLSSSSFFTKFHGAIQDYLQKKQALSEAKQNSETDTLLFKAGAAPRDSFEHSKTAYDNAKLQLLESTQKLKKALAKSGIDPSQVEALTIHKTQQVESLLKRQFKDIIVSTKIAGVALLPTSDQGQSSNSSSGDGGGGSDSQKKLYSGAHVGKGQTLLSVGDLSGLSTSIKVSEINVNRVKVGQPVEVTGNAFPGIVLQGQVSEVAAQATAGGYGSGLSMFGVKIKIPQITPQQAKIIHVGMTAKINMPIKEQGHISVPMTAVTTKNNQHYVTTVNQAGARTQVLVVTGDTTAEGQIAILKGLTDGQTIVAPLSAQSPAASSGHAENSKQAAVKQQPTNKAKPQTQVNKAKPQAKVNQGKPGKPQTQAKQAPPVKQGQPAKQATPAKQGQPANQGK